MGDHHLCEQDGYVFHGADNDYPGGRDLPAAGPLYAREGGNNSSYCRNLLGGGLEDVVNVTF